MRGNLQLLFIPASYWTKELAQFQILNSTKSIPDNAGFFLLWAINSEQNTVDLQPIENESMLEDLVMQKLPQIPAEKLLTCQIRLVIPSKNIEQNQVVKKHHIQKIMGKIIPIPPALKILIQLRIIETKDRTQKAVLYSDSIKAWAYLTKFAVEQLTRGNFVPILEKLDESGKLFEGGWQIILKTPYDYNRFSKIVRNAAWASYNIPSSIIKQSNDNFVSDALWHPSYLFSLYMNDIADFLIRTALQKGFFQKFSQKYGYSDWEEIENACVTDDQITWDLRFLNACIGKNRIFRIDKFCDTPIPNVLRNWIQNTQGFSYALGVTFSLRLEYPKSENSDWPLGYYIEPLHDPDSLIPLREVWSGMITQKKEFANACDDENELQEEILRALGTASKYFPPIRRSLDGKNPQQVKLKANEVMDFIKYSQHLLSRAGFNVILPEQFTRQGQQRLSAKLRIKPPKKQRSNSGPAQALFGMESFLDYEWEATLKGQKLTEQEFLQLANSNEPLIYWRDNWILIDQQDMDNLRPIFEKTQKTSALQQIKGKISQIDAFKLGMLGGVELQKGSNFEVVLEGDFANLIEELKNLNEFAPIPTPTGFKGILREYQKTALTWLGNMAELGLGICLADDMGLGKTVEVLAFLQHRKAEKSTKSTKSTKSNPDAGVLIVCPTSLLFNWKREINKFTPEFNVITHHGNTRIKGAEALLKLNRENQIILTTYGTIRNDIDFLETIPFTGIILDESQNIKNDKSQQTQAIMRLKSAYKIALSGTPIENRLMELWTLFNFLNGNLLGTKSEFQEKFIIPIERFHDEATASKLQKYISPFILRRLKTDKNIIQDLPEKNEIKIYLELTPQQASLYKKTVDETLKEIEAQTGNQPKRRGLILKLLTQTKQICNHPLQFQHFDPTQLKINENGLLENGEDGKDELDSTQMQMDYSDLVQSSVKVERIIEMIEETLERGEKLLIFTQFTQMGLLLQRILEIKYDFSVLFFHGGVPEQKRRVIVDDFQSGSLESSPILILSLKAGGTGLNLTRASTVFHFDRWWNPAVEDQATDRAYRIGQENRVNVYKFIARGTIEEKIDQILEEKRALADNILSSKGETWITQLSDSELEELFSLSKNHNQEEDS